MKVQVSDNWRITTDPHNFILERKHVKGEESKTPGEVTWKQESFHTSFDKALAGLLKKELLEAEVHTLAGINMTLTRIHNDIRTIKEGMSVE